MSEGILVLCESLDGQIKKSALELLGKATELSSTVGGSVAAVLVGNGDAASLGAYGASKVFHVNADGRDTVVLTAALQQAAGEFSPAMILGAASALGRDVFARLSIRLQAGLGSEITELKAVEGQVVAIRPQFGGKVFSEVQISSACKLFTVRPGAFAAPSAGTGSAEVVNLAVDASSNVQIVEVVQAESEAVDLTEADRIVSGGRSVKTKENFDALIRPLAKALGATAGASRAAVDAHYAEHSEQVGQTGKVVSPSLYFACGISGAIQHLAGMSTSRVIVSINKDANAPIFKHSTYGIVADMFDVIPALTKAITGGEIPVVDMSSPKPVAAKPAVSQSTETTPVAAESGSTDSSEKKLSLKDRLAAKKSAPTAVPEVPVTAPVADSVKTEAVQAPTVNAAVAQTAPVVSVDVSQLQAEVSALKETIAQLKSELNKSLKATEDSLKKELQRSEGNAKSFQDTAVKRIEGIEAAVTNEVRRIREKTREAMANEGAESRTAIFSLKSTASASIVLNILILIAIVGLWMTGA